MSKIVDAESFSALRNSASIQLKIHSNKNAFIWLFKKME